MRTNKLEQQWDFEKRQRSKYGCLSRDEELFVYWNICTHL